MGSLGLVQLPMPPCSLAWDALVAMLRHSVVVQPSTSRRSTSISRFVWLDGEPGLFGKALVQGVAQPLPDAGVRHA